MAYVAVDIDDNLYSFTDLARQVLADQAVKTGDNLLKVAAYASWPEWRSPPDILGLDRWLDIIEICHDDDMILSQDPYPGAADVLAELAAQHMLVYVSNRSTERQGSTQDWLNKHGFPSGRLVCAAHHDKRTYITDCQYIIDDRPKNLVDFVYDYEWKFKHGSQQNPRLGFGLSTEYNAGLTDIPGIYLAPPRNWQLLRHYLVKTNVLKELAHV